MFKRLPLLFHKDPRLAEDLTEERSAGRKSRNELFVAARRQISLNETSRTNERISPICNKIFTIRTRVAVRKPLIQFDTRASVTNKRAFEIETTTLLAIH